VQNGEKFKENLSISSCMVHVMNTNSNNQYMHEILSDLIHGYV